MKIKIIIILTLCYTFVKAQGLSFPVDILYLPQGYTHQDLTGKGFLGSTQSSISNLNSGNPACIVDFNGLNIGTSLQFESKTNKAWIADFSHNRNNYLPQSFGLSYSLQNIHFAMASNQLYNTKIDYGKIQGTMIWDNEQGYIETEIFHPYRNETIFKNSAISAIKLNNFLFDNSILSIGFQFNSNYYIILQTLGKSMLPEEDGKLKVKENKAKANDLENNFSLGFRYSIHNNMLNVKLGIFYESEIEHNFEKKHSGNSYQYLARIPQKLNGGISINFPKNIIWTTNFTQQYWESLEKENNIKNVLEWSSSVSFQYKKDILVSLATKTTNTEYIGHGYDLFFKNKFFAHYFVTGCKYNYKQYEFDIVIADSHLLSEEKRKHTIFKFGLGYHFNF